MILLSVMKQWSLCELIRSELLWDNFESDVTGGLISSQKNINRSAFVFAKESGIFSGIEVFESFQSLFENEVNFSWSVQEGASIQEGQTLLELLGPVRTILAIERTLLNFLSLSCGVATLTRQYVASVSGPTQILATRKTTPGLRHFQLQAVVAGGGKIHRRSLSDGILIKENHAQIEEETALLKTAHQKRSPLHGIEIEVQSFSTLKKVLEASERPDVIMLDNFSLSEMKEAVLLIKKTNPKIKIEASGGVNLETVRAISETGVDFISVGRLTHSAPILNLSLDFKT